MAHKPVFFVKGKYKISFGMNNEFTACYDDTKPIANNYWQAVNPLMKRLPTFMLQLSVLIAFTRVLMLILRPLRQPRFLSEVLVCIQYSIYIYIYICFFVKYYTKKLNCL